MRISKAVVGHYSDRKGWTRCEQVHRKIHWHFFSCIHHRKCGSRSGSGRFCASGHRRCIDGHGFCGGHISGAHYNPAVTLAVLLRGKCDAKDAICYWVSQVLGGFIAALAVTFLKAGEADIIEVSTLAVRDNLLKILLAEALFTFALAFVVLNVATAKGTEGNSFYGLAIGFTMMTGTFAVGGISGGVFNPAVAVGLVSMGKLVVADIWVYLVANFGRAAIAAIVFLAVNKDGE